MKKLMCIESAYNLDHTNELITKGKFYTMVGENPTHYIVIDNCGKTRELYKRRFKDLNCNTCLDRHCNSCMISTGATK